MDTITHGIAGALIGKAVFGGDEMLALRPMNRARIVTWSLMLGAIFPDSDVFRDMLSRNELLILTWHRSYTHSLLCLPAFAILLAALTRWIVGWRKWDAPSFTTLAVIYAVGILSHILLDLVTSFGTMIWSPLQWSRPAWDLIFIIDFTLSGILLAPQVLAWVYERKERLQIRAIGSWFVFSVASIAVYMIARIVEAPFSVSITIAAIGYVALAISFHQAAMSRVQKFAVAEQLDVQAIGALPMPPSLWHWDGLVRAPRGVYETRIDLGGSPESVQAAAPDSALPLEYRYYPDAPSNSYIESAKQLPAVQTFLWFARFPVTRFHKEGSVAIVEVSDLRFPHLRPDRPASFTYQVRFDAAGKILDQGWVKDRRVRNSK